MHNFQEHFSDLEKSRYPFGFFGTVMLMEASSEQRFAIRYPNIEYLKKTIFLAWCDLAKENSIYKSVRCLWFGYVREECLWGLRRIGT